MATSPGTASLTKTTTPAVVRPTAMPLEAIPVRVNFTDCFTFISVAKIDRLGGFYDMRRIILMFNFVSLFP